MFELHAHDVQLHESPIARRGYDRAYMRIGETMTVAWWQTDWMAFGKDGKLDMSGTVKNLKHVETVVRTAMSSS